MKSPFIQPLAYIRRYSRYSKYILIFIIGFLIALLQQFNKRDISEKDFFKDLAREVQEKRTVFNEDSTILDALHITNHLLGYRTEIFTRHLEGRYVYDGTLTGDLMSAKGACGSYADVLAQLLETMGFKTRIPQMKVGPIYGGHIITEVLSSKGWVVLDASNNLYFTTPAGKLASFRDVSSNWAYYRAQTPKDYNQSYRYEDARYTNWEKIPVVMPMLKKALSMTLGEKRVSTISLRPYFLRQYRIYCILIIVSIVFLSGLLLRNLLKRSLGRVIAINPNRSSALSLRLEQNLSAEG
jgi:hypothetical protein